MADDTTAADAAISTMLAGDDSQDADTGAELREDEQGEAKFTQKDLDRFLAERLNRERAQSASQIRDLSAKATRLAEIEQQHMSEQERAVAAARDEGRAAERKESTARIVDAHVLAAVTSGRLTSEQATDLLDSIDRSRFITGDYEVNTDKLAKIVGSFAGPVKTDADTRPGYPDLGQGRRTPTKTSTGDQFAGAVEGFFR